MYDNPSIKEKSREEDEYNVVKGKKCQHVM